MTPAPVDPLAQLSPRELACLRGVAEHKRSSQIAHELGLQPKTVDAYIANAMKKLGVSDRDTAARALLASSDPLWGKSTTTFPGIESSSSGWLTSSSSRLPWPFPTDGRPTNDLTLAGTIAAIIVAATFLLAVASLYLLSIRMLSDSL